jgi:hypothetical protein
MSLPAKKQNAAPDFSSDFPFGGNVPQDSHDSKRISKTTSESIAKNEKSELSLPLPEYLKIVFGYSEKKLVEVEDDDQWHSPCFFFAQYCKAHPAIQNLSSDKAIAAVGKVMKAWDELPRGADPWAAFFTHDDADEAKLDFMASWDSVRHRPFHSPLEEALRLAEQKPLNPPIDRGGLYARFISVAAQLQLLRRGEEIYLPTRAVAALLSCDQRTVSRLHNFAVRDGLLRVVSRHKFNSQGKSKATAFHFAVERLPEGWR